MIAINKPEKGSEPRQLHVSEKTLAMLNRLPKKEKQVFKWETIYKLFFIQRKKVAQKMNNPRILQIIFHTLRHWKGTMESIKPKISST
jgi:integrase